MKIKIESEYLNGVKVIIPEIYQDERGFFMESFKADQFKNMGLPINFPQENHSGSKKKVIRGLHFQWDPPMGKLMRVTHGSAFLVAVDIRKNSAHLGKYVGIECSKENRRQLWAPAGFARGFSVLSDYAEIQYKCSALYNSKNESSIAWNDHKLNINWLINSPIISKKDNLAQSFSNWLNRKESNYFTT